MTELSAWSVAILVNAEDENSRRWEFGADAAHDFDAVQARHRQVEHGDVGARLTRQRDGINPIGGFHNDVAAAAPQRSRADPMPELARSEMSDSGPGLRAAGSLQPALRIYGTGKEQECPAV